MNVCLFEDDLVHHLGPLTDTRPVYSLRIGARTIAQQTSAALNAPRLFLHTRPQLAEVARGAASGAALVNRIPGGLGVLFVNGRAIIRSSSEFARRLLASDGANRPRVYLQDGDVVAAWVPDGGTIDLTSGPLSADSFAPAAQENVEGVTFVSRMFHLLDHLASNVEETFVAAAHGYNVLERPGATIHESAILVESERIYVAPGATVKPGAILDASEGPIVIEKDATIFEGAVIKGPAFIGARSQAKVHANLHGVAFGPLCKIGGEVHDTIVQSHSNKAHDGFLGNSHLGSWCNLGAGTNNSNLKNDYGNVRLFNRATGADEDTGRQFVGLFMADHAKCGIGTTFNTGTVVGVACNLFGAGFHPRYVPSFVWGSPGDYAEYRLDKALDVAARVMARRDVSLTAADRDLLRLLFESSASERRAFLPSY